jgi:hypothetical protein
MANYDLPIEQRLDLRLDGLERRRAVEVSRSNTRD